VPEESSGKQVNAPDEQHDTKILARDGQRAENNYENIDVRSSRIELANRYSEGNVLNSGFADRSCREASRPAIRRTAVMPEKRRAIRLDAYTSTPPISSENAW